MPTTINSPSTHAQTQPVTGHDFVFARQAILIALAERLNALGLGLATLYGDVVGRGADTVRVTHIDGVGPDESFTTLAGETDPVPLSGYILDSDEMSIARHGLRKQMSYTQQMVDAGRPEAVDLQTLVQMVPESWLRTLMAKICATGATISAASGSTGTAWDVDKELALVASLRTTEGVDGGIVTIRHPEQYEDLRASLANESWFGDSMDWASFQAIGSGMGRPGGALDTFLGLENYGSFRVTLATDYQGFAYQRGALGWVVASTSPIRVKNPQRSIYVPQFGLVIEEDGEPGQATSEYIANTFFGTGKLAATVRAQRRIISQ